jgi:hypothetical protein
MREGACLAARSALSARSSTPTEHDEDTTELNKAEVVECVALVAHDQPAEIAEPGEEPLDFPAPPIAPQRAAILGLGAFAATPVRRDHLDAQLGERLVQGVSVVGAIPDEPLGEIR